jgi:hypothetical protein
MIGPDQTDGADSVDIAFEAQLWRRRQRDRTERLRVYTDLLRPLLAAGGFAVGEQSFSSSGTDDAVADEVRRATLAVLADVRRIADAARIKGE